MCGGVDSTCKDYYGVPKFLKKKKNTGKMNVMHQNTEKEVIGILLKEDIILKQLRNIKIFAYFLLRKKSFYDIKNSRIIINNRVII